MKSVFTAAAQRKRRVSQRKPSLCVSLRNLCAAAVKYHFNILILFFLYTFVVAKPIHISTNFEGSVLGKIER